LRDHEINTAMYTTYINKYYSDQNSTEVARKVATIPARYSHSV